MNPLSPKKILRNLANGYFMTHQKREEAVALIRHLQESNKALKEGMIEFADQIFALARELSEKGKS